MEIVPLFLEMVDTHTGAMTQAQRFPFFARLYKRLGDGMRKYGRPLTTNNGRDSLLDAWEEACDGGQYLLQAYCEGKLPNADLVHAQIGLMMAIERRIAIASREKQHSHSHLAVATNSWYLEEDVRQDGRTETDNEARRGTAEADAVHDAGDDPF